MNVLILIAVFYLVFSCLSEKGAVGMLVFVPILLFYGFALLLFAGCILYLVQHGPFDDWFMWALFVLSMWAVLIVPIQACRAATQPLNAKSQS